MVPPHKKEANVLQSTLDEAGPLQFHITLKVTIFTPGCNASGKVPFS